MSLNNQQDAENFAGVLEKLLFHAEPTPLQQPSSDFSNLL